ncbi:hypothetical protein Acsp05_64150 [Actinokineospora sp. NBRC 105648]|nr:hypothetical protein Acsp05_64150 [Actinokineospora sp. NBRC 105648]
MELTGTNSLAGLSLREVGIVPTAFYRHFGSTDELGAALAEESMRTLRTMLRDDRPVITPGGRSSAPRCARRRAGAPR